MDSDLRQQVEQKVKDLVEGDDVFTAFDVTQGVRSDVGRNVDVDHSQVKAVVHSMFLTGEMASYERERRSFPSGTAWVYFPAGKSADDHEALDVKDDEEDDSDAAVVAGPALTAIKTDPSDATKIVDAVVTSIAIGVVARKGGCGACGHAKEEHVDGAHECREDGCSCDEVKK